MSGTHFSAAMFALGILMMLLLHLQSIGEDPVEHSLTVIHHSQFGLHCRCCLLYESKILHNFRGKKVG